MVGSSAPSSFVPERKRTIALSDYICDNPVLRTDRLEWMPDKSMYKYWGKNAGQADQVPEMTFEKDVNNWNKLKAK